MVEALIKKLDPQGRVAIPAKWRSEWKSKKVLLIRKGDRIEVRPIRWKPPSAFFDSIEVSDDVDFTDSHSLKRALLEKREG